MSESIDFIIAWVDGNDPQWLEQYHHYKSHHQNRVMGDTDIVRFRDWGYLRYWFRGVEAFAPWVRKIHFVTWGHLPTWLNIQHPKINIVKHNDFIPEAYLPTFNSHTIELNFHRIKELSPHYVYFNDDMFLIDSVKRTDFFRNGLPCDAPQLDILVGSKMHLICAANFAVIARHQKSLRNLIGTAPQKWFHPSYGLITNIKNARMLLLTNKIAGIANYHLAQAMLKECLEELWTLEYSELDRSCRNRFRTYDTVNQYLQRYWALASQRFSPYPMKKLGQAFNIHSESIEGILSFIKERKKALICLNDDEYGEMFEVYQNKIDKAFYDIIPQKSDFEKNVPDIKTLT